MNPKILIVAGGLGTRLSSLTKGLPKCLIDIVGKPLIQHQIEFFKTIGLKNFVFCIGYGDKIIKERFRDGSDLGVSIEYSKENFPLGTAGAVKFAANKINNTCIVYYGDNLTRLDFQRLLEFHRVKESDFTIVLKEIPLYNSSTSLVTLNNKKMVTLFIERPEKKRFQDYKKVYRNNGIYVMNKKILDLVPKNKKYDFGYDLIPDLIQKNFNVYGYVTNEFFQEIGRPEKYERLLKKIKSSGKVLK